MATKADLTEMLTRANQAWSKIYRKHNNLKRKHAALKDKHREIVEENDRLWAERPRLGNETKAELAVKIEENRQLQKRLEELAALKEKLNLYKYL